MTTAPRSADDAAKDLQDAVVAAAKVMATPRYKNANPTDKKDFERAMREAAIAGFKDAMDKLAGDPRDANAMDTAKQALDTASAKL